MIDTADDRLPMYAPSKLRYEAAVVQQYKQGKPMEDYTLTIGIAGAADNIHMLMPVALSDSGAEIRTWEGLTVVNEILKHVQPQVLKCCEDPYCVSGRVVADNDKYVGLITMTPLLSSVEWVSVDKSNRVIRHADRKAALAYVADLLDHVTAYKIDWCKISIGDTTIGKQ